jgi:hypothetical protein
MYLPYLKYATPVRRYRLGNYMATLLSECQTTDSQLEYAHVLVIYQLTGEAQTAKPALVIASETNPNVRDEGYYFLCSFASEHRNYGASHDWADLDKFESAALQLAGQMLEVSEPPQVLANHHIVK